MCSGPDLNHAKVTVCMPFVAPSHLQEYVPFQPYVEGPLLVVLHVAKTLPRYISSAAAGPAGSSDPSPLAAVFGGLSGQDAAAASQAIADPARLGKLKRDLYFRSVCFVSGCAQECGGGGACAGVWRGRMRRSVDAGACAGGGGACAGVWRGGGHAQECGGGGCVGV
jgi:hypothetical protein